MHAADLVSPGDLRKSGFDSRAASCSLNPENRTMRIVAVLKSCDLYALYCDQPGVEVEVVDYESLAESADPDSIIEVMTEGMQEVY